jgi:hypothetical protein
MGRGRAKAKQQKVARDLKYNTHHFTDLDALQRELGSGGQQPADDTDLEDGEDDADRWAHGGR